MTEPKNTPNAEAPFASTARQPPGGVPQAGASPVGAGLNHFNADGQAHMVDVGDKAETRRVAIAQGTIRMQRATWELIRAGNHRKGDVIGIARIAAIQAAKRTADLIPLCHPVPLTHVDIEFGDAPVSAGAETGSGAATHGIECTALVECVARTGVEIEAMAAVQIGLLTIYDMCKAVDRGMVINHVRVRRKEGGRSGEFVAP